MSYTFCHNEMGYSPDGATGPTTPKTADERNRATSLLEVESFKTDEPGPYFAYWKTASGFPKAAFTRLPRSVRGDKITTWTGGVLATIIHAGEVFQSNMGDERQNFRALGINGATYTGTAYLSAGDYVRMRPVKG